MSAQTETQETEAQSDGPLLDLTDAGVKKFIKQAKARGYVTMEDLNKVLPSEEVTPDAIEDTLAMLSEMGVNVVEAEEDATETTEKEGGEVAERAETSVSETPAKAAYDRTDDPVRMYLREMGSVELLSREGEIAIAKRIEAGRDAMISGLCESALTFEQRIAHRRMRRHEGGGFRDRFGADRIADILAGEFDATAGERHRQPGCNRGDAGSIGDGHTGPLGRERGQPVQRAAVEIVESQRVRHPLRDGALAGSGGSIDRDHRHRPRHGSGGSAHDAMVPNTSK